MAAKQIPCCKNQDRAFRWYLSLVVCDDNEGSKHKAIFLTQGPLVQQPQRSGPNVECTALAVSVC